MNRGKRLVLTSHCILNQNSVVSPLARAKGPFYIVNMLVEKGIGIIQLPCPEFKYLGLGRKPMSKEEYDVPEYRELCKKLFQPFIEDLREYLKNGYEILGIIGVKESPTCSISGNRGIFMEEIFKALKEEDIKLNYFEIPPTELDNQWEEIIEDVKKKLNI